MVFIFINLRDKYVYVCVYAPTFVSLLCKYV